MRFSLLPTASTRWLDDSESLAEFLGLWSAKAPQISALNPTLRTTLMSRKQWRHFLHHLEEVRDLLLLEESPSTAFVVRCRPKEPRDELVDENGVFEFGLTSDASLAFRGNTGARLSPAGARFVQSLLPR